MWVSPPWHCPLIFLKLKATSIMWMVLVYSPWRKTSNILRLTLIARSNSRINFTLLFLLMKKFMKRYATWNLVLHLYAWTPSISITPKVITWRGRNYISTRKGALSREAILEDPMMAFSRSLVTLVGSSHFIGRQGTNWNVASRPVGWRMPNQRRKWKKNWQVA